MNQSSPKRSSPKSSPKVSQPPPRRRLNPLCDQIGRERVERTVSAFYARLLEDPMLRGYFQPLDLGRHIPRIIEFWWIAMGGRSAHPPTFDMIGRHGRLGLHRHDLERWLAIFEATVHDELPAELAAQWTTMAEGIAGRLAAVLRG